MECPIEWCMGVRSEHGGDGAGPEHWVHADEGVELVHGAALYRSQTGPGPALWQMIVGGQVVAAGKGLPGLAAKLRDIAGAVECVDASNIAG